MKRLLIASIFLLILITTFTQRLLKVNEETILHPPIMKDVKEKGVLTIAVDESIPGYFNYNGCEYGFQYDILRTYATSIGVELEIISKSSIDNALDLLNNNKADIVVTMEGHRDDYHKKTTPLSPIYKTNYVLLARRGTPRIATSKGLKSVTNKGNTLLSQPFTTTQGYEHWQDSISSNAQVTHQGSLRVIEDIAKGKVDYFVCEGMEAALGCFVNKNVEVIYSFNESVSSVLLVDNDNSALAANFNKWIESFRGSAEYSRLEALYYESGFTKELATEGFVAPQGAISPYDELIKNESQKAGLDWRLVSAIAYHESRFKPDIYSPRSACGLMQVMPAIARQFNMSADEMVEPQKNVEVALKLINKISSSLRFSSSTSQYDKTCIILACYNGGIGHVLDARKLAVKYGESPNSWVNVAKYLALKSQSEFYNDEVVRSGRFSGSNETLSFVKKVMDKYDFYCQVATK